MKPEFMNLPTFIKILAGIIFVVAIVSFGWWGSKVGSLFEFIDSAALREWFDGLGAWGPVAVICLMVLAILVSPIPSAPIALSAGAIYGHFWGALYVLIGSEIGAFAAFGIARF
ncbi:MAG: TVP38/TMEM64 family protein, partial [Rhizobiales bacterium]|nr:TVP38/TMEM64 family protein [Hyphomicrobiales bacterium]